MPAKIERKILRIGDSKAATLPPDWLRAFNIDVGDKIEVIYNSVIIIKPKSLSLDADFLKKELDLILKIEGGKIIE